jgi:hypothetical protein
MNNFFSKIQIRRVNSASKSGIIPYFYALKQALVKKMVFLPTFGYNLIIKA